MKKSDLLNELLEILTKHMQIKISFGKNYEQDRMLFRGLCNGCLTLNGIGERFYNLQDILLSTERDEKGIVDVEDFEYKNNISLWQGDITRLKADAIVNAANDQYLGCFVPCHNCIDNIIMSASGFQMREELLKMKDQSDFENQKVKVTKGYNLPSRFVFHVAGPEVFGCVTQSDRQHLASCYVDCLDKAQEMHLKNIVFCCIATGLYSFPNEEACNIAVHTVRNWLERNKSQIKVVFNVFKDIDRGLYERKLR